MARPKPLYFEAIKAAAIASLEPICRHWLPNGKCSGREWPIGDRSGADGQSLKVCLEGNKAGVWSDFASGDKGGDAISLVAFVDGGSQGEAAAYPARLTAKAANHCGSTPAEAVEDERSCHVRF
ncbi:hypothetical protein [Methylococcus sp. EFPC2]|uniref:hypothetical protein n=1 Tax=Methylococcus sp. EFPC2 TaxID=2812648 RepID=UPI001967A395|nr:hypothetical protein [Methylococcus sp. EFPC2]QSA97506.1 hypothetical protein JWZ97_01260 [Methylococcus sp. EFPC2]